jgi:hypothetical protein
MISINSPLTVFQDDSMDLIDRRTLNALHLNADIFTIKDLVDYCSNNNYEWKLSSIKGLWKWWILKIKNIIWYLVSVGIIHEQNIESNFDDVIVEIDEKIYQTSLWLYPKYISLRTLNALNNIWIFSIQDLFKNRNRYLHWAKWLGNIGRKEIEDFIAYVNINFIKNKERLENNNLIENVLEDERLLNILRFHLIDTIDQLTPYIQDRSKFDALRYFNNKDFEVLRDLYFESMKNWGDYKEYSFSETFLSLLNNLSEVDKSIFENRILWSATLSETGEKLWITRERVRQKQKNIESIITNHSNSFMHQNPEVFNRLANLIHSYTFIFLPQDIKIFDFLWFSDEDFPLLYLTLKWLEGFKWEIIDNSIYCIFSRDINLTGVELTNLYIFINQKIHKNNDDISIDEFFYECKIDDALNINFNKKPDRNHPENKDPYILRK